MVVCHERRSWIKAWPGRGGGCSVTYAVHSSRCDGGSETYISPAITPQRSWESPFEISPGQNIETQNQALASACRQCLARNALFDQ